MLEDGTYPAVLDRIEDGLAVLILEPEEAPAVERVIAADRLPADAGPDAVLTVELADGDVVETTLDPEATEERRRVAKRRFDRLSRRPDGEDGNEEG